MIQQKHIYFNQPAISFPDCEAIEEAAEADKEKKALRNLLKGEVPILAGQDDIPVRVVRSVLMCLARELHPHR